MEWASPCPEMTNFEAAPTMRITGCLEEERLGCTRTDLEVW